jgi:Family of unknown function (DUF6010)
VLPYVVLLALCAVALAGVYLMPEMIINRGPLRLTAEHPHVPLSAVRGLFPTAALATVSTWSWLASSFHWDVVHHLYGNPIVPFAPLSSAGCAVCDLVLAGWYFAGAPLGGPRDELEAGMDLAEFGATAGSVATW